MRKKITNFKNFLYICWKTINLPDPTPIQYDIADFLQKDIKNKIIQAFRGIGKTYITAAYVCFRLYLNPDEKILIVSASLEKAKEIAKFIKRLLTEVDELKHLVPNTKNDDRDAITSFDVAGCTPSVAPSVKVLGVSGQLTGCRATIIIPDDIETSENCRSQEMRERINNAVTEFDNIVTTGGEIVYLGTPHAEDSLYKKLKQRGYVCKIWTCRYVNQEQSIRYDGSLADFCISSELQGQPTEPLRFSEDNLLEREMKMGRSKFQMQFMLDPSLSDMEKYPLKLSDLIVMDCDKEKAPEKVAYASDPSKIVEDVVSVGMGSDRYYKPMYISDTWLPYTGIVMFIDPSGRGQDETAYAIVGMLNSQLFCLDFDGYRGGYDESTLKKLAMKAYNYKVTEIVIESNFGDGMFTKIFEPVVRRIYPCTITEVKNHIQKEQRIIDILEPVLNQHKLIMNKVLIKKDADSTRIYPQEQQLQYQLFYQMTRITRDKGSLKHDDRLDAIAGAVSYWTEHMAMDIEEEIRLRKEEAFEAEINKFLEEMDEQELVNPNLDMWCETW